jgi:hypothetical protein
LYKRFVPFLKVQYAADNQAEARMTWLFNVWLHVTVLSLSPEFRNTTALSHQQFSENNKEVAERASEEILV